MYIIQSGLQSIFFLILLASNPDAKLYRLQETFRGYNGFNNVFQNCVSDSLRKHKFQLILKRIFSRTSLRTLKLLPPVISSGITLIFFPNYPIIFSRYFFTNRSTGFSSFYSGTSSKDVYRISFEEIYKDLFQCL